MWGVRERARKGEGGREGGGVAKMSIIEKITLLNYRVTHNLFPN